MGVKFSNEILDIIDTKNSYIASTAEQTTILPIIESDKSTYYSELIFPIIIQGDVEGVIILSSLKENSKFENEHIVSLKLISKFLSKQME